MLFFFFPLKNMLLFSRGCGLKILGIKAGANEYGRCFSKQNAGNFPPFLQRSEP